MPAMNERVDPRVAHTRRVVLEATVAELTDVGFERISIDAIAERSGVARSTIYRNWTDRETLLAEAFRVICPEGPSAIPATEDLGQDLANLGRLLAAQLAGEDWGRTVPTLIGAAVHDEAMADLLTTFADERRSEARAILVRAVERGDIQNSDRFDEIMERFVAPFFARRLLWHRPIDDGFITAQVESTLAQLRTTG